MNLDCNRSPDSTARDFARRIARTVNYLLRKQSVKSSFNAVYSRLSLFAQWTNSKDGFLGRLGTLRIHFEDIGNAFAECERKVTVVKISVHSKLLVRYAAIQSQTHADEQRRIVVFVAFVVLHELAHVFLRWMGVLSTPPKQEAGNLLESNLLSGSIAPVFRYLGGGAKQARRARRWSGKELVPKLVIKGNEGVKMISDARIQTIATNAEGNTSRGAIFPLALKQYRQQKNEIAYRSTEAGRSMPCRPPKMRRLADGALDLGDGWVPGFRCGVHKEAK
mmetsp:Transcript_56856/g.149772  ORF Transcript_56856/g.149772 Transcript_56856/m.149772 type:complete len:278 (+) Transcript_56856:38-871(+)